MSDKVKIKTKVTSFEDVQKSLQDIEKNFNKLSEAVNKKAESEQKETEGKSGDTKATNEGTNAGNDYKFEVKTDKGWQSPILKPHYESDWESISNGGKVKFKHQLGSKLLFLQIFFKCNGTGNIIAGGTAENKDEIFSLSHYGMHEVENSPVAVDAGISVFMEKNYVSIGAANHRIFMHDNTDSTTGGSLVAETSGFIKLLAWKTGIER